MDGIAHGDDVDGEFQDDVDDDAEKVAIDETDNGENDGFCGASPAEVAAEGRECQSRRRLTKSILRRQDGEFDEQFHERIDE